MNYINVSYIKKISNLKYPQIINNYSVSTVAKIELLKKHRNKLTIKDITDIIEECYNKKEDLTSLIMYIENVFDDIEYINDDDIIKIHKYFRSYNTSHLISFLNKITNKEIFVGDDIKKYTYKIEDILKCRSYRIYKITN